MKTYVAVTKDEDLEQPVPSEWRKTFFDVVEAFRSSDFKIERGIPGVETISDWDAQIIAANIKGYGGDLASLSDDCWDTSVYRWMGEYWDVLVDLPGIDGPSDLVLFARVYEMGASYKYFIDTVHIP